MVSFNIEGITEYVKPFNIKGKEILVLNDIHLPFHDKKALNIALQYAKECDTILLNGDIIDFYGLSRFIKNPEKQFINHEIAIAKEFLQMLRDNFKGEILYKIGNHEDRLTTYIFNKAPALWGVENITLKGLLELDRLNIKLIDSTQLIKISSLIILHGHEIFAGAGMVNIARSYFMKANENILFGHRHQVQDYFGKSIDGKIKGSWAVGCLCDLNPRYMPTNNWGHGFARISKINSLEFDVKNYKIIQGKVY